MTNLYIMRHGETKLNGEARIRGWLNPPLESNSKEVIKKSAKELSDKNIHSIHASDLQRAIQTAKIVGKEIGIDRVNESEKYRPWDMGDLTGMKEEDVRPIYQKYMSKMPNVPLPHGESFDKFKDRFLPALLELIKQNKNKNILLLTHHRNERLVSAWQKKGGKPNFSIDINEMMKKGVDPGKILIYKV